MDIVCVCRCALCVVIVARSDLFFPITPTAYVWFIYIHGYPDNEAFNPGDPVVRTMNPITSCRLWDGMADSETDGRGCTRAGNPITFISLASRFPCSYALQQLINRQGPGEPGITASNTGISANTHEYTCAQTNSQRSTQASTFLLLLFPTAFGFPCKQTHTHTDTHPSTHTHTLYNDLISLPTSPARECMEEVLWAK